MITLKARNLLFALGIIVLPVLLVKYLGNNSLYALDGLAGVLVSLLIWHYKLTKLVFILFIVTVLFSVSIPLFGGAEMTLPGEPLALLLAMIAIWVSIREYRQFEYWVVNPIVVAILLLVVSWLVSSAFSTMPVVSYKYVFINLVYMCVGLILFPWIWMEYGFGIEKVYKLLWVPILLFALYAFARLAPYGFNPGAAALMGQPFFKDHTIFSATFSMVLPIMLLWRTFDKSSKWTWLPPAIGVLLLGALFISSSRAAWIAVLVSGGLFAFVKMGGTLKLLLLALTVACGILLFNWKSIEEKLMVNPYTSTDVSTDLETQVLSVGNVTSDVSNIERLNRWKCAYRMGLDRPFTGFGPGTYQFQYFPYQRDEDMTYISVTSPFTKVLGRGGSAHSEYLLLLSESGILGVFSWIALQFALLVSFFKAYAKSKMSNQRNLLLACYLGLLTYTVHSIFNNYLNTVQFGIIWWMMVGALLFLQHKIYADEEA